MATQSYDRSADLARLRKQWRKLRGLHSRVEWSAAVMRAATAAEIAATIAIRSEFAQRSQFDDAFVDSLLRWANGLDGKLNRLLIPLHKNGAHAQTLRDLRKIAEGISEKRNGIAHSGEFCGKTLASALIGEAKNFVETLVGIYEPGFQLDVRSKYGGVLTKHTYERQMKLAAMGLPRSPRPET